MKTPFLHVQRLITLFVLALFPAAALAQKAEPAHVAVSDIHKDRVQLIGLLGKPLGKVMKITGRWQDRDAGKGTDTAFAVTHVDGVPLKAPVVFESFFVHASTEKYKRLDGTPGDVWQLTAYEGLRIDSDNAIRAALEIPVLQNPWGGIRSCITGVVTQVNSAGK